MGMGSFPSRAAAYGAAVKLKNRFVRIELTTLGVAFLAMGSLWGFIEIADEVGEGETRGFDQTVLLSFRNAEDVADPLGPVWLEEAARDFTALGGTPFQVYLGIGIVVTLVLAGKWRAGLFIALALSGAGLLNAGLKEVFDRPRPDLVPHVVYAMHSSFPSGHSMSSTVTYLTLGAMLARLQPRRRVKLWLLALALITTGLVGLSRVYLGVHWPSDVVAGWVVGLAYATSCWLLLLWLQRHGEVEESVVDGAVEGGRE